MPPRTMARYWQQPGGDFSPGSDDRIVFAGIVQHGRLSRPLDQLIGHARQAGDHDGHIVAGIDLALDVACHVADALIGAIHVPPNFITRRAMTSPDAPKGANKRPAKVTRRPAGQPRPARGQRCCLGVRARYGRPVVTHHGALRDGHRRPSAVASGTRATHARAGRASTDPWRILSRHGRMRWGNALTCGAWSDPRYRNEAHSLLLMVLDDHYHEAQLWGLYLRMRTREEGSKHGK